MKQTHVYCCEDSVEGILTAVYQAWASRYGHENNKLVLKDNMNYEFFCEYIEVVPDDELSKKVIRSIKQKIGNDVYQQIYYVLTSNFEDKADIVYRYMILGFAYGKKVTSYLSNPVVSRVEQINTKVGNEMHYYREFVRFEELKNGVLLGRMRPHHNVIGLVAPHFADRLPMEDWVLYDVGRKDAALHQAGKEWVLLKDAKLDESVLNDLDENELDIQKIWKRFVKSISIKQRENLDLQRNNMPYRYREFMPELDEWQKRGKNGR